ncbi:MAG: metal ABC transporter substrate-binding protein [Oscillospiraceae bacterium]|nr:metal ABC transporter substrate-binding protein [Oscillospiraceae bacterium]
MKKIIAIILALTLALSLAACGGKADDKTIKVGTAPGPHPQILEFAKEALAAEGYTLEIIEFSDYILPNTSLNEGQIDANYFQHITYMNNSNVEYGIEMVNAATIHYEPYGLYAGKTASIDALAEGAQIAVPNDATNEARALLLLEQAGLIKLAEGAGINATKDDIVENPLKLDIYEANAELLTAVLQDVDMAVINGNYAIAAEMKVADALAVENADGTAAEAYANIVTVMKGHENDPKIQALVKVLTSKEVKGYIEETWPGAVVPLF